MAAGTDVIGSAADLISSVDLSGTIFDGGGDSTPAGDSDLGSPSEFSEGEETPIEADPGDGIMPAESEGEVPEEEDPAAEEPPAEPAPEPQAQSQEGDLPDGVRRGKDRSGKDGMWLTPQRYEQFHGAHRTLRDFEAAIGEPVTADGLDVRNRAFIGQERLYGDLLSAEPEAQAKVLDHFMDEAARAQQDGEVGSDPVVPLATTFYDRLREKSPDGYAHLRMKAANDLVTEMYQAAQQSGDKNLAISASHIAKALGMPYKKDAEITQFLANRQAQSDPVATLKAQNQALQEQLNGRQTANATAQFNSWQGETRKAVTSGVLSDAILPSLTTERKAWEKFPTQFENLVVTPLNKAVNQTIVQDKNFAARIQILDQSARRATSAQKRAEIGGQIKNLYVNRALQAVEAHKGKILTEAATLLKQGNSATHQRHQAAQQQRGPRGAQAPAPQSLLPKQAANPGGVFDVKSEVARMRQLLG